MIIIEKCSEVLALLIDEASERFSPLLIVDSTSKQNMIDMARQLDIFIETRPVMYFDVRVDEDTTDITISVACNDFITENKNDPLYNAVLRAKSFTIGKVKDEIVGMTFIFDGVWNPV